MLGRRPAYGAAALAAALTLALFAASCSDGPSEEEIASAKCLNQTSELFDRKIKPLLETDRPKTCNQCHLSGVDLSLFVRDTMCETRACLLENGLVDPSDVENSRILAWIARAHPDSTLITQQVIDDELQGFRDYLSQLLSCSGASCKGVHCSLSSGPGFCASSPEPSDSTPTDPSTACDVISIEQSFRDNVYAWRDRCFPCHFESQTSADPAAPRWISVEGGCDTAAVATLRRVIDGGYLNTADPSQSLLLLKPLAVAAGGVIHGGGDKFHDQGDSAYESFLSFIEYYASCVDTGHVY